MIKFNEKNILDKTEGLTYKKSFIKVFIQEDDKVIQKKIKEDLKDGDYIITFFSKSDSLFDLLALHPDILIQDYKSNKSINCYEWVESY
jgi:hypothetical protein